MALGSGCPWKNSCQKYKEKKAQGSLSQFTSQYCNNDLKWRDCGYQIGSTSENRKKTQQFENNESQAGGLVYLVLIVGGFFLARWLFGCG